MSIRAMSASHGRGRVIQLMRRLGYGRYGVLSERTCPSDGLLSERYRDTSAPASTWWSYNAWAAGSAMEAIAEKILSGGRAT